MTPQSSSLPFGGGDGREGGDDDVVELAEVVLVETMVDKVVGAGGAGGAGGAATSAFTFAFATLLTISTSFLPEPEPVLGGLAGVDGVDVGGADEEAGAGAGRSPEEPPPHTSASSVE